MEQHCRVRVFQLIGVLFLFLICVHGRRKYPQKVHAMVQEQLARRRYGSEMGQWSSWGAWSPCSRSCGGGITTQTRACLQSATTNSSSSGQPRRRGRRRRLRAAQCTGSDKRFHMCSEQDCPDKTSDLRAEQCTSFNEKPYNNKLYRWRPHYSTARPCSLTCRPENAAFYITLQRRVQDGTRCSPEGGGDRPDHICAAGVCKHIACDGVVGSPRVRDACGVCGGNNSTCQIISGIFTEPYLEEGYRLVAQIPAGACSIYIQELSPTSNYLALRDIRRQFILNGDWNIDNSGQYQGAGATFVYRRQSDNKGETIAAVGPITEPVDIFILYRQANRGIKYEYAIKRNNSLTSVLPRLPTGSGLTQVPALPLLPHHSGLPQRPPQHRNTLPQSTGNQQPQNAAPPLPSDGPGGAGFVSSLYHQRRLAPQAGRRRRPATGRRRVQKTGPRLVQKTGPRLAAEAGARTDRKTGRTRPGNGRSGIRRRRRRRRRSRFQWVVPGYSECTKTCGGGTKMPEVVCMRKKRKQLVRDSKCEPRRRPQARPVPCNTSPCPASGWEPNAWSPCSTTCGSGHQTRTFLCVRAGRPVEVTDCVGRPTQPDTQPCNLGPCLPAARWQLGEWSPCSVSCGWGTRTRSVSCTDPRSAGWCPEADRPRDTAPCRRSDCPAEPPADARRHLAPAGWMATEWTQQCSVECGQGVQSRGVTCGGDSDRCDASQRPLDTRPCKTDRGCGGIWFTGPWSQCSRECGAGQETRSVICIRQSAGQLAVTAERSCAGVARPADRQACGTDLRRCRPRWFTSEWAACSASCGPGRQRRVVACVGSDGRRTAGCEPAEQPADRRPCLLADCPKIAAAAESAGAASPEGEPEQKPVHDPALHPGDKPRQMSGRQASEDEPGSRHEDDPSAPDSSWSALLRAQTADQPVTAPIPGTARNVVTSAGHTARNESVAGDSATSESVAGDSATSESAEGESSITWDFVGKSVSSESPADESGIIRPSVSPVDESGIIRPPVSAVGESAAEASGDQSPPVAASVDGWSSEAAAWLTENVTTPVPASDRPDDQTSTAATAAPTEPLPERTGTPAASPGPPLPAAEVSWPELESSRTPERPATAATPAQAAASRNQAGAGARETHNGSSSGSAGGNDSDSCTDKVSSCSLVQQARLCQYHFYAISCCAACKGGR